MKIPIDHIKLPDFAMVLSAFALLILGSLGSKGQLPYLLMIVYSLLMLYWAYLRNKKLHFPPVFFIYTLFLVVLIIHTYITKGILNFVLLFVSGGLIWLSVYNNHILFKKYFIKLVILLGLSMLLLWFLAILYKFEPPDLVSLYFPALEPTWHSQLGDLWSIIIMVALYLRSVKRSWWHLPIIIVGFCVLFISYSRSAYLSLFAGLIFLFHRTDVFEKWKKQIYLVLSICVVFFFVAGSFKTVLFSRPYFFQALIGMYRFPLGLGMGGFAEFSHLINTEFSLPFLKGQSLTTHSLILDVMVGLGIFSISYLWFLFNALKSVVKVKDGNNLIYAAIFLNILVNFLFNYSFLIPSMFWLWMISLSLAVDKKSKPTNNVIY